LACPGDGAMSAWRRVAIEKIPRFRALIQESENVWRLWNELFLEFVMAHKPPMDEELIHQVHDYALWCIDGPPATEAYNAAAISFYESLPIHPEVVEHMATWMSPEEFSRADQVLRYFIKSDEEFERFVREFHERRERLGLRSPAASDEQGSA